MKKTRSLWVVEGLTRNGKWFPFEDCCYVHKGQAKLDIMEYNSSLEPSSYWRKFRLRKYVPENP